MKKVIIIFVAFLFSEISHSSEFYKKAYFAGGCFWCVEEYFDKQSGVISTVSGYSGGTLINPTYKQVTYEDTGHVEVVEVTYDSRKINFDQLMEIHIKNIDPFDGAGQFCDKGKSYRSVIFYKNQEQKNLISKKINKIENTFGKKTFILSWKFQKFYSAEDHHQDYYEKNFINYLLYKSGCGRENRLKEIWN